MPVSALAETQYMRPPGAVAEDKFLARCNRCQREYEKLFKDGECHECYEKEHHHHEQPKICDIKPSGCVVLFVTKTVPAAMGDSVSYPPRVGQNRNVVVRYEADKTVWLYDSKGIPTQIGFTADGGGSDIQIVQTTGNSTTLVMSQKAVTDFVTDLSDTLSKEITDRTDADTSIQTSLTNETNARTAADQSLTQQVQTISQKVTDAKTTANTAASKADQALSAVQDMDGQYLDLDNIPETDGKRELLQDFTPQATGPASAQATATYVNVETGDLRTVSKAFPIVTSTTAGLSPASDHNQIQANAAALANLPVFGTMASETATDYRKASAQDAIDKTHLTTITGSNGVTVSGTGQTRNISFSGIELPNKFMSTDTVSGNVGTSSDYSIANLSPIGTTDAVKVGDTVIFVNGQQGQVTAINGDSYTALIVTPPQQAAIWGAIGGNLSNQTDLQSVLDTKVDTVDGMGLSSNDYTDAEKAKLASLHQVEDIVSSEEDGKVFIEADRTLTVNGIDQMKSDTANALQTAQTAQTTANKAIANNATSVKSVNGIEPTNGNVVVAKIMTDDEYNQLANADKEGVLIFI